MRVHEYRTVWDGVKPSLLLAVVDTTMNYVIRMLWYIVRYVCDAFCTIGPVYVRVVIVVDDIKWESRRNSVLCYKSLLV